MGGMMFWFWPIAVGQRNYFTTRITLLYELPFERSSLLSKNLTCISMDMLQIGVLVLLGRLVEAFSCERGHGRTDGWIDRQTDRRTKRIISLLCGRYLGVKDNNTFSESEPEPNFWIFMESVIMESRCPRNNALLIVVVVSRFRWEETTYVTLS